MLALHNAPITAASFVLPRFPRVSWLTGRCFSDSFVSSLVSRPFKPLFTPPEPSPGPSLARSALPRFWPQKLHPRCCCPNILGGYSVCSKLTTETADGSIFVLVCLESVRRLLPLFFCAHAAVSLLASSRVPGFQACLRNII
jgi:hypothetical protein